VVVEKNCSDIFLVVSKLGVQKVYPGHGLIFQKFMVDHGRRQKVIGNTQIDRQTSGGSVHTHVDGKEFICFKYMHVCT
jgi:hypothetical protein